MWEIDFDWSHPDSIFLSGSFYSIWDAVLTVLSSPCALCLYVCDTFLSSASTPQRSASQVRLRQWSISAVCMFVCVFNTSLAEPHLTTQQLSQKISIQPATLQEPLSKRPLPFCCPHCLFLQMKGQPHHTTNKLPLVWLCQIASPQVYRKKTDFFFRCNGAFKLSVTLTK